MSERFLDKEKPSADDYLKATLEEIVERANKSTSESEIPFVTALLSAKANRDQKNASNRMFWVALASTAVAFISLATSFINTKQADSYALEISTLEEKLGSLESEIVLFENKVSMLEAGIVELRENQTSIDPGREHNQSGQRTR